MNRDVDWVAALGVMMVVGMVVLNGASAVGIGSSVDSSTYTGHVVDIERDSGFLFKTTEVHLKTSAESASSEEFCVLDNKEGTQLPTLTESLKNGTDVNVSYSRPIYVSRWSCESGLSIIREVNA